MPGKLDGVRVDELVALVSDSMLDDLDVVEVAIVDVIAVASAVVAIGGDKLVNELMAEPTGNEVDEVGRLAEKPAIGRVWPEVDASGLVAGLEVRMAVIATAVGDEVVAMASGYKVVAIAVGDGVVHVAALDVV